MRDRHCPACGHPIYRTHQCRASTLDDPPTRPNRQELDRIMKEARAEARAERAQADQLLLEVEQ